MNLEEVQTKVVKNAKDYEKRCNFVIDEDFALIKLYEEVGEFAQAVLIHRKKCRPEKWVSEDASKKELAKELADILGMVLLNAELHNVDLSDALNKKWFSKEK